MNSEPAECKADFYAALNKSARRIHEGRRLDYQWLFGVRGSDTCGF